MNLFVIFFVQEKEDPDFAIELRKMEVEYERKRLQRQIYYGKVYRFHTCVFIFKLCFDFISISCQFIFETMKNWVIYEFSIFHYLHSVSAV